MDKDLKGFLSVVVFLFSVSLVNMFAGQKATYNYLLLVLFGVLIARIDTIKSILD